MKTIDAYIKGHGHTTDEQKRLRQMRTLAHKAVPKAEEAIKWGMPTFVLRGKNVVIFAAFKAHIGFFVGSGAIAAFKKELKGYTTGRSTIQLPHSKPIPAGLVSKIMRFCAKEVIDEIKEKAARKKKTIGKKKVARRK